MLPGFRPAIPVVFCGLFPVDAAQFEDLRAAMGKLRLNDASFSYEMETSAALGFGFRCGFLGLLHLEIIQERLQREFNLELIATAPSVIYKMKLRNGSEIQIHNPVDMPDVMQILEIEEPWIEATILTPDEYLGSVLKLCQDRRGTQKELTYVGSRAMVKYDLPLNEVVFDFYDRLKSVSQGYASFDYHLTDFKPADLVKMQILVNGEPVDALAMLVHSTRAEQRGRAMVEKLKELIPPHMFQVPIQAAIGGKIIARETVRALRKDVTGEMLRRRRDAQAQASREAEGRQEEDAPVRQGRHPAGGVHRGAEGGCVRLDANPGSYAEARTRAGKSKDQVERIETLHESQIGDRPMINLERRFRAIWNSRSFLHRVRGYRDSRYKLHESIGTRGESHDRYDL
jgi:GTP-binding protein LepA